MLYTPINWSPAIPSGFGSAPLVLPRRTPLGWRGNASVRTLKPAAGNVYYVDVVNGDNANTGLDPNLPVKWIWIAMDKADSALGTIKVAPGIYPYVAGWRDPTAVGALSTTASYSVERWPIRPGPVLITSAAEFIPTWTQEAGPNTACWTVDQYSAAGLANTITQVVDLAITTPDGSPWTYYQVPSIAACQATPGSWYVTSVGAGGGEATIVTVHTLNGGAPGRHILCLQTHTAAADLSRRTVYIDGLTFIGGGSGFIRDNNSGIAGGRLYAKDCISYGCYVNGFQANGLDHCVMEDCIARDNRGDGMVYNQSAGLGTVGVEIGCKWLNNGGVAVAGIINETINGSTAHASSRILRIGCHAERNSGPNFADTNGCLSWFVGCTAGGTNTFITAAQNAGFQFTNASTGAWLLECAANGAAADLYLNTGATVRVDRCSFGVTTNSGGTLSNYTNS